MQGIRPFLRWPTLLWSTVSQATNQDVCKKNTAATDMAQQAAKDRSPGNTLKNKRKSFYGLASKAMVLFRMGMVPLGIG